MPNYPGEHCCWLPGIRYVAINRQQSGKLAVQFSASQHACTVINHNGTVRSLGASLALHHDRQHDQLGANCVRPTLVDVTCYEMIANIKLSVVLVVMNQ